MAKLLIMGTAGMNDPTKATMPFVAASAAIDKGIDVALILSGDATLLYKDSISDGIHGLGMPPLKDLMAKAVTAAKASKAKVFLYN